MWIEQIVNSYQKFPGGINFIFCSDDYLLQMHKKFLNKDTYTDILTFNYNADQVISGDVFISIDRVKENAEKYVQGLEEELHRVMIHGILHLLGFEDTTTLLKKKMTALENSALALLKRI
ncbi:MAG: rRNA maturation RNase YbeY [Chitinophagales bacterium]|nr:rRNA maturation RNase YbeY [Chitinophagales bacterium]